jgi:hypothetical protein
LGIFDEFGAYDARAVRGPTVETFPEGPLAAAPLELPVSVGDVIAYCIAEDVLKGFGFGDVGTGFTDYSNKFTLVVNASSFLG